MLVTTHSLDHYGIVSGTYDGSVAKNPNIEAKLYFHSKDHKKAKYFSDDMQI
jgi:hypothetical protein